MFITVETLEGGEATFNTAFVTHVIQLESMYHEGGSCVHFTSDRMIQVKPSVSQIRAIMESSEPVVQVSTGEGFMLRSVPDNDPVQ